MTTRTRVDGHGHVGRVPILVRVNEKELRGSKGWLASRSAKIVCRNPMLRRLLPTAQAVGVLAIVTAVGIALGPFSVRGIRLARPTSRNVVSTHGSLSLLISLSTACLISDDGALVARLHGPSSASNDEEIPRGPVASMAGARDRGLGRGDNASHRTGLRARRASANRFSRDNWRACRCTGGHRRVNSGAGNANASLAWRHVCGGQSRLLHIATRRATALRG